MTGYTYIHGNLDMYILIHVHNEFAYLNSVNYRVMHVRQY